MFDSGIDLIPLRMPLGFKYGPRVFGPEPEVRELDAIRPSLLDPACDGPAQVYAIGMDVGKLEHRKELKIRRLLFGVVTYATGRLGQEPIRSQGHVHKVSSYAGSSTPEVYEIWEGCAVILMQETDQDNPGRCFAVEAQSGEVVVVPPGWAHATISADPTRSLTFGAWADRNYGFDYDGIRSHGGMAWFARVEDGGLEWEPNPAYVERELIVKRPEDYLQLGLDLGRPIYLQYEDDPERFMFVPEPRRTAEVWPGFLP